MLEFHASPSNFEELKREKVVLQNFMDLLKLELSSALHPLSLTPTIIKSVSFNRIQEEEESTKTSNVRVILELTGEEHKILNSNLKSRWRLKNASLSFLIITPKQPIPLKKINSSSNHIKDLIGFNGSARMLIEPISEPSPNLSFLIQLEIDPVGIHSSGVEFVVFGIAVKNRLTSSRANLHLVEKPNASSFAKGAIINFEMDSEKSSVERIIVSFNNVTDQSKCFLLHQIYLTSSIVVASTPLEDLVLDVFCRVKNNENSFRSISMCTTLDRHSDCQIPSLRIGNIILSPTLESKPCSTVFDILTDGFSQRENLSMTRCNLFLNDMPKMSLMDMLINSSDKNKIDVSLIDRFLRGLPDNFALNQETNRRSLHVIDSDNELTHFIIEVNAHTMCNQTNSNLQIESPKPSVSFEPTPWYLTLLNNIFSYMYTTNSQDSRAESEAFKQIGVSKVNVDKVQKIVVLFRILNDRMKAIRGTRLDNRIGIIFTHLDTIFDDKSNKHPSLLFGFQEQIKHILKTNYIPENFIQFVSKSCNWSSGCLVEYEKTGKLSFDKCTNPVHQSSKQHSWETHSKERIIEMFRKFEYALKYDEDL